MSTIKLVDTILGAKGTQFKAAVTGRLRYIQDASDFYDRAFNDKRLGYITVDFDVTERTTLNIAYSQIYSNKNLSWGGLPTSYGYQHLNLPRSTYTGADWEYNKNEVDTLYVSLVHDFGAGWKLDFNGTYAESRYDILGTWMTATPDAGGYGHTWWATKSSRTQKAGDLMVSGPVSWFGRTHNLVLGTTLNRQTMRSSQWIPGSVDDALLTSGVNLMTWNHIAPRPDTSSTSPWLSKLSGNYKQDSLYSAGKFSLSDPLDLILGARLDWYHRQDIWGGAPYSINAHLTNYAGLVWKLADQHSAYVSYTDVFQPQNVLDIHSKVLSPISGRNLEIGIKGEYLGGALNGSIALFRVDERNRPVPLSDQSACPSFPASACFTAAGLVRTEGVDVELQGAISPTWQIGAGLTWSETRYRRDSDPANIGKRLGTTSPTTLFRLSTQYALPGALNRLTLGGRINWQDKVYYDGKNASGETTRIQQGARAIVDLSASYRLTKNTHLKFDINNVFDKKYYSTIASYDWPEGSSESYGRPRSVLATLHASF